MTTPTPLRSTYARHLALLGIVALTVTAVTLFAISSPLEDADARPATELEDTTASYAAELLDAEISRAETAVEDARIERLERFAAAVTAAEAAATAERIERFAAAVAEAERVAAEQAAARAAAASAASTQRSSMGGGWAALRRCESGGNYSAVSSSGAYRGAYQFSRSTWNAVARRSHPHLVGVDPAAAAPADQDAMAMSLYRSSGSGPWPHCGRHL